MTLNSRAKGARAEVEAVKLIHDLTGYPTRRLRGPGANADAGDIGGVPGCVVEVKDRVNVGESISIGIPQARAAAQRTGTPWPTVWVRLRGGRWVVVMEPDAWAAMHRAATA